MASLHRAFVGLGSNLNNPVEQLARAVRALHSLDGCTVKQCSPLYWNAAMGPGEQPDYLNGVVSLQTRLNASDLLNAMRHIEDAQGRSRGVHWGPRTMDLDLLLYDDITVDSEHLTIPHPRLQQRNFVVYPLYDIAPALQLPNGRALSDLVEQLSKTGLRPLTQAIHQTQSATTAMQTLTTISELRAAVSAQKKSGQRIAFVPTMGNLHDGHLDLVRRARAISDCVVVSIFVNPLQFGPNEDLTSYPRTLDADQASLAAAGTALLFVPAVEEMYPQGQASQTIVTVPGLADILCGTHRPGHFNGVTTVVSKLFNIVAPDCAVFGEKDFQQLAIIRRMCEDLSIPVEVIGVATARAADGLALSSRNIYLSEEQREIAPILRQTLLALRNKLEDQPGSIDALQQQGLALLTSAGFEPDYLEIRDASTLGDISGGSKKAVILAAARLGKTRLIDNTTVLLNRE